MRLRFVVLLSAVLGASLVARGDTLTEAFTVTGGSVRNNSFYYGVASSSFAQFDPSLGTLDTMSLTLNGIYSSSSGSYENFFDVTPASDVQSELFRGSGSGIGVYSISVNATQPGLIDFEGTGTQGLVLNFSGPGSASATGSLTYNYTPASVTPEPSSFALLGTGILGVAATMRRRWRDRRS